VVVRMLGGHFDTPCSRQKSWTGRSFWRLDIVPSPVCVFTCCQLGMRYVLRAVTAQDLNKASFIDVHRSAPLSSLSRRLRLGRFNPSGHGASSRSPGLVRRVLRCVSSLASSQTRIHIHEQFPEVLVLE
jgi:hypothetical protein